MPGNLSVFDPTVLAALLAGLVGPALVVLLGWARDRRKSAASVDLELAEAKQAGVEGDVSVASVVLKWSEALREELTAVKVEVEGLRIKVALLERENRALRRHNHILTEQVLDLGGTPMPMPEE